MAKCFFTGVEAPPEEMYVLDVPAARRALRDLRKRITVIERLVEQLNSKDDVEVYDFRHRHSRTIKMFRLVNPRVAEVLAAAYPWEVLFITWENFKVRLLAYREMRSACKIAALYDEQITSDADEGCES